MGSALTRTTGRVLSKSRLAISRLAAKARLIG